jgi:erythritol transport system ATP-binding protein
MDEPTSALSASEVAVLFRIIRDLTARGVAIVYISHRLAELLEIADTVSVLRDGRMVAESEARDIDIRWIVEQMTGRPLGAAEPPQPAQTGAELLRVDRLSLTADNGRLLLYDVGLHVHAGEVLGVYGLMGAGRTELLECLMGLHPEVRGSIVLDSKNLAGMDIAARIAAGLSMVPEDRQIAGLVQSLSVLANMTLASLDRFARGPLLSTSAEEREATVKVSDMRLRTASLYQSIGSLSGGNQQKVVIAKCLLTNPRVLLLDEPTRGVDVGAKREIHAIVRRLAAAGMAIVLVSSELEEVRITADRILVMSRGSVTGEFTAANATDDALAAAASAGVEEAA